MRAYAVYVQTRNRNNDICTHTNARRARGLATVRSCYCVAGCWLSLYWLCTTIPDISALGKRTDGFGVGIAFVWRSETAFVFTRADMRVTASKVVGLFWVCEREFTHIWFDRSESGPETRTRHGWKWKQVHRHRRTRYAHSHNQMLHTYNTNALWVKRRHFAVCTNVSLSICILRWMGQCPRALWPFLRRENIFGVVVAAEHDHHVCYTEIIFCDDGSCDTNTLWMELAHANRQKV